MGRSSANERGIAGLRTAALALAIALSLAGGAPAFAQTPDDGCDPNEPVACLVPGDETPSVVEGGPAMPSAAPDAAGAARPAAPAPLPAPCYPVMPPQPMDRYLPAPAAPDAAAAPLPRPDCSPRLVYAAINRANANYVRAMRTLDTRPLIGSWAGEAYNDIARQIADLRLSGQYADLRLHSITPVTYSITPSSVQVRTLERWTYTLRLISGSTLVWQEDQVVYNDYTLVLQGGNWIITRDVITRAQPQLGPPLLVPGVQ